MWCWALLQYRTCGAGRVKYHWVMLVHCRYVLFNVFCSLQSVFLFISECVLLSSECAVFTSECAMFAFRMCFVYFRMCFAHFRMCFAHFRMCLVQIPRARSLVTSGDVYILDAGLKLYQFNGSSSSPMERSKVKRR